MEAKHELKTMTQRIPQGATADDISTIVRSILRLPFRVSEINIDSSGVTWKVYIPKSEPPDGVVLDPTPGDITELLAKVELTEVSGTKTGLNLKSFSIISQMLFLASKKTGEGLVSGMKGVAWVTGSSEEFCKWLGVKPKNIPTKFLNLPLIESDELPSDRLILLCARSDHSDHLESESGIVVAMVRRRKSDV